MLGIDIFDAGLALGLLIALSGGLISFISPCVLPIVPAYLAYMSGMSFADYSAGERRGHAVLAALFFVLGLSVVFLILGFAASSLGILFLTHQILLGRVAGLVILVFGLHFLGIIRLPILDREARLNAGSHGGSLAGAFLLGLAFAFGWTPCIGPVLGAVLSLAAQEDSVGKGTLLLAAYAAGLGIPFVLAAAFIDRSRRVLARIKPWMQSIERGIGVLLLLVGLLLISGRFASIAYWLLEIFPWMAFVG
ncbi:MAG: cytochrome c biogenesis protein CcdA [Rhodobacteraceae bacterium]|nr:cytochrome c biogenesis protein CcdA [Paracoccaceae bacterium]